MTMMHLFKDAPIGKTDHGHPTGARIALSHSKIQTIIKHSIHICIQISCIFTHLRSFSNIANNMWLRKTVKNTDYVVEKWKNRPITYCVVVFSFSSFQLVEQ